METEIGDREAELEMDAGEPISRGKQMGRRTRRRRRNIKESDDESGEDVIKRRRKRNKSNWSNYCHQCHRNRDVRVVLCKGCGKKKYCVRCIATWYRNMSEEDFAEACPVCRGTCNCRGCLRLPKVLGRYDCTDHEKVPYSKYVLKLVLPYVKRLHDEQLVEKEIETRVKGLSPVEIKLQQSRCSSSECLYCVHCGNAPFDLYRSCSKCPYNLCLVCCQELRAGRLHRIPSKVNIEIIHEMDVKTSEWKARENGCIPCPPENMGGCGLGILVLKHKMPVDWVSNLLKKAQELSNKCKIDHTPQNRLQCCVCEGERGNENSRKTASREYTQDNYLYYPSAKDNQPCELQHFQWHWARGEPVIVRDVLETSSGLSWEPMVMLRAIRQIANTRNSKVLDGIAFDYSKGHEVNINLHEFFRRYSKGRAEGDGWPLLKLQDWPPLNFCEKGLPPHFLEFINCLPFKAYTHPCNGYLNLKIHDISSDKYIIPKMHLAYGAARELKLGDSVTKLHCKKFDVVNLLAHIESVALTPKQLHRINTLKQKCALDQRKFFGKDLQALEKEQKIVDMAEGGALWDIFRRQDIHKLEKYLRTHMTEFKHIHGRPPNKVVHPIHEETFYLTMEHKRKLKEEFGIEPWTLVQKRGEAVFIPAGCPHQVRNLKSCINVSLQFLSPESLGECGRLRNELRILPQTHKAKEEDLELEKVMLYALKRAVKDLDGLLDLTRTFQDPLRTAASNNDRDKEFHEAVRIRTSEDSQATSEAEDEEFQLSSPTDKLRNSPTNTELPPTKGSSIRKGIGGYLEESDEESHEDINSGSSAEESMDISEPEEEEGRPSGPTNRSRNSSGHNESQTIWLKDVGMAIECPVAGNKWHGYDVGEEAAKLLQAIEDHHPETFKEVNLPSKEMYRTFLKELFRVMRSVISTPLPVLDKDRVSEWHGELNVLEKEGFDLSWAHEGLQVVEKLKFGNNPLLQELVMLDGTLSPLKEKLEQRECEHQQALTALEAARKEYERAKSAREKAAKEVTEKVGDDYNCILKGHLGSGMLPGY